MSDLAFDNAEFARRCKTLAGEFSLEQLPRIAADVPGGGPIEFGLAGGSDDNGRSVLDLRLVGNLQLRCQRCLKPLAFELDVATRFTLFAEEGQLEAAEDEDDSVEGLLVEREFYLLPLIEDEILLSLPYAPTHEACESDTVASQDSKPEKPNPFAVLAALKGKLKPETD